MKIFMRSPREWILYLANSLSCETVYENKQMFQSAKGFKKKISSSILSFLKKSPFPPLEWIINYNNLYKINNDIDLIIEPASKLIKTDKNYIVYIENGIGLFSFNTRKINYFNILFFKRMIKKKNLKGFVFYSHTALNSTKVLFNKIGCPELFETLNLGVIYPLTHDIFSQKTHPRNNKKILFCSSSFNLKGGRELLKAFFLSKHFNDCELILITTKNEILTQIEKDYVNITVFDFNLKNHEYVNLIESIDLIIHPTFFDTHALALLEAIKASIPAIATKTFALPEYIEPNRTGLLIDNPYEPYTSDGAPNFTGAALIYAQEIEKRSENDIFIKELTSAIDFILDNYSFFKSNCLNSDRNNKFFSEKNIISQWAEILKSGIIQK